jgi:hypothetical protein
VTYCACCRHTSMPAAGAVAMFQSLAGFVGTVYGGDDQLLNSVLEAAHEGLDQRGQVAEASAEAALLKLLQLPLQARLRNPVHRRPPCVLFRPETALRVRKCLMWCV